MSNNQDERLDEMLRARRITPASPDLAQRIILKAQRIPQTQTDTLMQWFRRLFAEFHLPKPAYVLAGTLIVGLAVGFYTPVQTNPEVSNAVAVQSFLYVDEELL
ncbi:MAG: hypothetical protein GEU77_08625 [Deltaproteobacteria bacterium]|nr:hypothetical protein [Deltaproteobacteria bacterium]